MRNSRRINKQGAAPRTKKLRCLLKLFALVLLITGANWGAKYAKIGRAHV